MAKEDALSQGSKQNPQYSVEIIEQFIKVQSDEIELRKHELELRKQQDQNGFQFAKESLNAQKEDRREGRDTYLKVSKYLLFTVVAIVFIIAVLLGFAIYMNNAELAIKIVEYFIVFSAGGAGGYSIGKNKKSKAPIEDNNEN